LRAVAKQNFHAGKNLKSKTKQNQKQNRTKISKIVSKNGSQNQKQKQKDPLALITKHFFLIKKPSSSI
jgi:hypothetical protein